MTVVSTVFFLTLVSLAAVGLFAWTVRGLGRLLFFRKSRFAGEAPHWHLVEEQPLVEIGRGSRRSVYRIGETGFCVKFYRPPEDCVPGKMKASIRRDITARRFDKFRNSSSEEVYVYDQLRRTMPETVREKLPAVCERVYHPEWGWGVLETYYTNPDGTAIIPYEFEIGRQKEHPEIQTEIYRQARNLLLEMIAARAYFHEPGNFHVLLSADGHVALKLIDFEPESKTLVPLEMVWPWFRELKLRRKVRRYLSYIREAYRVAEPDAKESVSDRVRMPGVRFVSVAPFLGGKSSKNYKATAEDGREFFVKFAPKGTLARLLAFHAELASPLVPTPLAHGSDWIVFPWRAGVTVHPADMTDNQIRGLIAAMRDFHRVSSGRQHGDMHYRNVLFEGDVVVSIVDLECMREGTPTDDLFRFFVHEMERTRFWRFQRMHVLYGRFAFCVRASGYSRQDWMEAIDRYEARKRLRRTQKKSRWAAKIETCLRGGLYRALRKIVATSSDVRPIGMQSGRPACPSSLHTQRENDRICP